jgi:hypothetical protein
MRVRANFPRAPISRRAKTMLIISAAALAPFEMARAQAIFTTAPQEIFRARPNGTPSGATPAPNEFRSPSREAGVATASPIAANERHGVIRHLTNNIQGYRLSGEIGALEWPIYLTEQQARRRLRFQLGYLASVSVMPEASTLTLTINDEVVDQTPIRAVQSVRTVVFDIPEGLMRAGFNSVRLSAEQRHRVDCSLEATFELWTQIDPTQTGLILPGGDAGVDNLADLGALLPDEQGALPIRAVIRDSAKTDDIERMLRAVQLISIVGRFEQPVVDSGPLTEGRYGVNLLVGTAAELAKEVKFDFLNVVDRPRAFVLPATPERRTTIVITGVDAAQVDEAMKLFLVAAAPNGSEAGLRAAAAFPGVRMQGGQRVKLSEIGIQSQEFTGRLFRAAFNIIMPPDFYAADYGRAYVHLAGGYAGGLNSKAQIVMNVNDRTAVSLSLLRASGEVFKENPLPLPLGFLRPGLNRIEIEAHVPKDSDASCDPLSSIRASKRFLLLDSTEIELPPIARVGRMPDLAVTASGGFPYANAATRPKLFLPSLDRKSVGAAATIVAHLAIAAARPIDFQIATSPPSKGPILAVAPFSSFEPSLLEKLGMPVQALEEAWKSKLDAGVTANDDATLSQKEIAARNLMVLQDNFPMACHPPKRRGGFRGASTEVDDSPTGAIAPPAPARDLFAEWDERVRRDGRWANVVHLFDQAARWGKSKFTDAATWVKAELDNKADEALASPQSLLAIGQNILGESSEDVWTIVTSPNVDTLVESVGCLVDPRVSRQISGGVSVLDMSQAKINVAPVADARFVMTQPLSVGNARLIAAGWLSLHATLYVLGAMMLAGLLAVATRWFVRHVGRRT